MRINIACRSSATTATDRRRNRDCSDTAALSGNDERRQSLGHGIDFTGVSWKDDVPTIEKSMAWRSRGTQILHHLSKFCRELTMLKGNQLMEVGSCMARYGSHSLPWQ
jgi:hypothetical protein